MSALWVDLSIRQTVAPGPALIYLQLSHSEKLVRLKHFEYSLWILVGVEKPLERFLLNLSEIGQF